MSGWASGLCEFCDRPCECCVALFFPCVAIGMNVETMDNQKIELHRALNCCRIQGLSNPVKVGTLYGAGVAAQLVGNGFVSAAPCSSLLTLMQCGSVAIHASIRNTIRNKYQIPIACQHCCCDECEDFCTVLFCTSCALIQERKTLERHAVSVDTKPLKPPNSMSVNHFAVGTSGT